MSGQKDFILTYIYDKIMILSYQFCYSLNRNIGFVKQIFMLSLVKITVLSGCRKQVDGRGEK